MRRLGDRRESADQLQALFATLGRTRQVGNRVLATVKYTFDDCIDDGLSRAKSLELVKAMVESPNHRVMVPVKRAA